MRLLSFLLLCSASLAQDTGAIVGKIVDEFGEPVSGAIVIAGNSAGQEFKTTAGASGEYMLDNVVPGAYRITATMSAMKKFDKKDFIVESSKTSRLDVTLLQNGFGTLGDGDRFTAAFYDAIQKKPSPTGPTPRLADGKPDLSGFWLKKQDEPETDPPAQSEALPKPWAEAIRKERQISNDRDDPYGRCLPGSVINTAGRGKFVHIPGFLAMLVNPTSFDPPRQIFVDGRLHPNDLNPTWRGHSIGHWEGDTLVVDTVSFNGLAWYSGGLPSTENLHVIERYRRPDLGRLELEITVEDPAVLEKPWIQKRVSRLVPDEDIEEEVCVENNKDLEHMVGK